MSLADYRSQLPHHFSTDDPPAGDPGASKAKIRQREQGRPTTKARVKVKPVHRQPSSSSSSSEASTSRTSSENGTHEYGIQTSDDPSVTEVNKSTTQKISGRPSQGFIDIVEYRKYYDRAPVVYPTETFLSLKDTRFKGHSSRVENYAIVLRRTCHKQFGTGRPVVVRTDLEIHSEPLCIRFREIAANSYMDTNLDTFPIMLSYPFFELFFYRAEIRALANNPDIDPDLRRDAQALDEFVHRPTGSLAPVIEGHERFEKEGKVTNDIIWTIYPPNSLLVYDTGAVKECYICRNMARERSEAGEKKWVVTGLRIGFDGQFPVLVRQQFDLPSRGSELIEIGKLTLQPLEVYSARKTLERLIEKRAERITTGLGTRFRSFVCREYSGPAWGGDKTNPRDRSPCRVITERLMLDFTEFPDPSPNIHSVDIQKNNRGSKSMDRKSGQWRSSRGYLRGSSPIRDLVDSGLDTDGESSQDDFLSTTPDDRAGNTPEASSHPQADYQSISGLAEAVAKLFNITVNEFGLLFPALVPAFGLSSTKWWWILSDRLQVVEWNKAAFDFLQHNQDTRHLVQTLIKGYKRMSAVSDNVVAGQRQGVAFHIHGGSGLGKRYTAETIAEYLERPLYTISTSGSMDAIEAMRLGRALHQAERWNAVALFEEADVLFSESDSGYLASDFLARRTFVRELGDFQGVLIFKTATNKGLNKDIKSLIHLTIRCPALSSDAQARIWENLLQATESMETDNSWNDAVFGELGKLSLNGRIIKNILRTAVAFAKAEEKPLGARHVLTILQTELSAEDSEDDEGKWEKQVQPALHRLHEMLDIPFQ